jgi:hydroxymethylglutaryl-CoA synthase
MASERLFEVARSKPRDYTHAVFHQPNGKFPATAAKALGFTEEQYKVGLLAPRIGNTYSGAILLGLCNVLDQASAGDRIFLCGYGSGAGADAFDLTVTRNIDSYDRSAPELLETQMADTTLVDYATYAKHRGKLVMAEGGDH